MNTEIKGLFNEYLALTEGDKAAAASLVLADTFMQQPREPEAVKPPQTPPDDRFWTLKEAAAYLGCAPYSVWKMVGRSRRNQRGFPTKGPTLQFFQNGPHGRLLFKKEWLDEFIQQHHVQPYDNRPVVVTTAKKRRPGQPLTAHQALVG